ncbi:MAG TPA: NYN domain-containing protein [Candidatus Udaeobacter sp.]|nr:NYN domain-containing protein [Candidatus Udaeobacter sp.]
MSAPFGSQRLAVLVDVQNIYYPAKSLGDKVNFHSLLKRFQNRQLVRAIAYVVEAPDVDVSPFVSALHNIGFEVRVKPMKVFEDGTRKGDIHLLLALDALSLADKVDAMCLVTGDGEYVDLVHLLRAHGVKVEVMSFKSNTSSELLRVADEHFPMNEEYLLGFGVRGEERDRVRPYDDRPPRPPFVPRDPRPFNSREPQPALGFRRDERYPSRPPLRDERFTREERSPLRDDRFRARPATEVSTVESEDATEDR